MHFQLNWRKLAWIWLAGPLGGEVVEGGRGPGEGGGGGGGVEEGAVEGG